MKSWLLLIYIVWRDSWERMEVLYRIVHSGHHIIMLPEVHFLEEGLCQDRVRLLWQAKVSYSPVKRPLHLVVGTLAPTKWRKQGVFCTYWYETRTTTTYFVLCFYEKDLLRYVWWGEYEPQYVVSVSSRKRTF